MLPVRRSLARDENDDRDREIAPGALRVGVNLFPLALCGGGMRQYVLQLLPWLVRLSGHRFLLFHGAQGQPSVADILRRLAPAERSRVRAAQIDSQDQIFRRAHTFDLYFCPLNGLAPDLLDRPTVATLADVQERFFPNYFTPQELRNRAEFYPHTAHAATVLLTLSEFSKQSICSEYGANADKVVVAPLTPGVIYGKAEWPAQLPPLPARYIFYPANLYPHKNHVLLLDALRLLHETGVDCACILTGQHVEPGVDILREAANRGLSDKVRWLGHVDPASLRWLYENAVALAFPSQFEGFGMPLVEAMACGCPVVATPVASIPEVVGDAALLVEPTPEALAGALRRLLTDAELRRDLTARGLARAERFQDRRLAEQTLAAMDAAVARFGGVETPGGTSPTVCYGVQPSRGGRGLAATLASLAYEAYEHDEILILAAPGDVCRDAEVLAHNLGVARFVPDARGAGAWLDEARCDLVCILREGDRLVEGATRAVRAAFAERPGLWAVAGQALGRDRRKRLTGVRYRPPQSYRPEFGAPAPSAAVFWKRSWLKTQRNGMSGARWPDRLLRLAPENVHSLNRTVVYVPGMQPVIRATARAFARRLPRWLKDVLRRFTKQTSSSIDPK